MSKKVLVQISFRCYSDEWVSKLAYERAKELSKKDMLVLPQVLEYLTDVSLLRNMAVICKTGICLWGRLLDDVDVDLFVEQLKPFWDELLRSDALDDGPFDSDKIIILSEKWGEAKSYAHEIFLEFAEPEHACVGLTVRKHENPYSWNL